MSFISHHSANSHSHKRERKRKRERSSSKTSMDFPLIFIVCFFLLLTSLVIFLFSSSLRLARERSSAKGCKLPPGPTPLPVVGNLLQFGSIPHRTLAALAKTHGPLMSIKLGSVITVVASSPDFAREILQKNDQALSGRTIPNAVNALNYPQASIAWLPTNQTWRDLRRIFATQLTTTKRLDANKGLRSQKIRELTEFLHQNGRMRQTVDVGRAAFTTTLNMMSNLVFSINVADFTSKSTQEFKDTVSIILEEAGKPDIADFFPWLGWLDPQGRRRQMTVHFKKLHEMFDELIDCRLMQSRTEAVATQQDLLDLLLLDCQVGENGSRLDRHAIKSLLVDFFIAGTDTSSNTVEWAMAELLRNPKAMAKVREELTRAISSEEEVDESDVLELPYLQAVVKETFRLHPVGPLLLPHRAETSVELQGYTVPKHAQVLVNVWAIGRDPDVWSDPESFLPERFLGMDVDFRGRNFELIPFGSGRRICPGLPLANRMLHVILASFLRWFDWKLPDGMQPDEIDMTENYGISLGMAVPLLAIPIPN